VKASLTVSIYSGEMQSCLQEFEQIGVHDNQSSSDRQTRNLIALGKNRAGSNCT